MFMYGTQNSITITLMDEDSPFRDFEHFSHILCLTPFIVPRRHACKFKILDETSANLKLAWTQT